MYKKCNNYVEIFLLHNGLFIDLQFDSDEIFLCVNKDMKQLNFTVNSYYFIFNIVLHSQKKKM